MPRLLGYFRILLICCSIAFLAAAQKAAAGEGHAMEPFVVKAPKEKTPAKDFRLKDIAGNEVTLESFKGKVVILHFWASWCEPCKIEFPALKRLSELFRDKGLVVVGISEDSRERTIPFVKERGVAFPILFDQYGGVMRDYRVSVIPVSVIVNRDGSVEGTLVGPREYDSREAIEYFERITK